MKCPRCGYEDPEGMKFCGECGAPLPSRCPQCGSENPPQFKFCGACGTPLPSATPAPPPSLPAESPPPSAPPGERRQLTVMFCDLVGSTPLSTQLDPEELTALLRTYQETCGRVIRRFEGHIAKYLGDGLLVFFGYPQAHEDDAHRAARAGLGMVEAMGFLNERLQAERGVSLALRVGIHTGLVVVEEMGAENQRARDIVGETLNLAARLQQEVAAPNTVVMSEATHRLVAGFFACRALGPQTLRGIPRPVPAYQVVRESAARSRLEAAATTGRLTPWVGREAEMELLQERWEWAREGRGQVVWVCGEAGIGKSRLVQVLKEAVAQEPEAWLVECQGSPYHQNSALYPVVDLYERVVLQFDPADSPEKKRGKLEGLLVQHGLPLAETVPLLAPLWSLPWEDTYPPLTWGPEKRRHRMLEALLTVLLRRAAQQPVLLVIEDLQWADPSTLELLGLILDQAPTTRLLAVGTYRPVFQPPWPARSYITPLTLSRLPEPQVEAMVAGITGGKSLPAEVRERVVRQTDGVPLFVEELTKTVLESGLLEEREDRYELTGPLPPLAIPTTLEDALQARLDRLSHTGEVAQWGAVLGREFPYELLQAVGPWEEEVLQAELGQLVAAELLYQRGFPPQASYQFKHALVQEAAYQSLLRSTRQQWHQRTAEVLVARFPQVAETQPEVVARHYTQAGLPEPAIAYWQRAGQRSLERFANAEAIQHLRAALDLLASLPDTPERAHRELKLRLALGPPLMALQGWAAPEVEQVYRRARELCQQVEETPHLFPALAGLCVFHCVRGDFRTARELGAQCLRLAQKAQDSAFLLEAHSLLGTTSYYIGEFVAARQHLEQAIALYDRQQHFSLAFRVMGADPGVWCRSYAAVALWVLGHPEQAWQQSRAALALAQALSHPFSLAFALFSAAGVQWWRGEVRGAQEQAEAFMALALEHGFSFGLALATFWRGWALAAQGRGEEGIARMRQGLSAMLATGGKLAMTARLAQLAEGYGHVGQAEEGLKVVAEALALADQNGERYWKAEICRIQGELLKRSEARSPEPEREKEAEACFHQALEIARGQSAKSLELRAAMSLSRLWREQGKRAEARALLGEVYGWFTEGFDTADVQEAKALLEEL